jgi:hypothetical protein
MEFLQNTNCVSDPSELSTAMMQTLRQAAELAKI